MGMGLRCLSETVRGPLKRGGLGGSSPWIAAVGFQTWIFGFVRDLVGPLEPAEWQGLVVCFSEFSGRTELATEFKISEFAGEKRWSKQKDPSSSSDSSNERRFNLNC